MNKDLENIFKEKFDSFSAEAPAGMFDAILAKRKRRKAAWMWSSAAVVVLGIGLTWYTLPTDRTPITSEAEQPIEQVDPINNTTLAPESTIEDLQNANTSETSVERITNISSDPNPANEVSIPANTSQTKSTVSEQATEPNPVPTNESSAIVNEELAALYANLLKNSNHATEGGVFHTRSESRTLEVEPRRGNPVEEEGLDEPSEDNTINNATEEPVDVAGSSTEVVAQELDPEDEDKEIKENKDGKQSSGLTPIPSKKRLWSASVLYGPGLASRVLSTQNSYTALRNASENAGISQRLWLDIGFQLSDQWSVHSGAIYNRRSENYNLQMDRISIQEVTETRTETIIHPVLGEITREVEYTRMDTTTTRTNYNHNNKFSSVSIPVLIKRTWNWKENWKIQAQVGFEYGISQKITGQSLSDEETMTALSQLPYRANVNRINLGLGLAYRMSDRTTLLINPQANYSTHSQLKMNNVDQKEYGIFIPIGLRIDL